MSLEFLGSAIRLGCDLAARTSALLANTYLTLESGQLVLSADSDRRDLLRGDQTARRVATLAGLLGVKVRVGEGSVA